MLPKLKTRQMVLACHCWQIIIRQAKDETEVVVVQCKTLSRIQGNSSLDLLALKWDTGYNTESVHLMIEGGIILQESAKAAPYRIPCDNPNIWCTLWPVNKMRSDWAHELFNVLRSTPKEQLVYDWSYTKLYKELVLMNKKRFILERKIIATSMEPDGINNLRLSTGSVRYKQ